MSVDLEDLFPNLGTSRYEIKSEETPKYNCIAWAANVTTVRWWPRYPSFWPRQAPRERTLDSFVAAFGTLGYEPCDNEQLEIGFEKVAIYIDSLRRPTHMARQLESGIWTSKLGDLEDIEHDALEALFGVSYGYHIAKILKRPR